MKKRTEEILKRLDEAYGTELPLFLHYQEPWQLLFATILSAQCTDARVNEVTAYLFKKYPTLKAFADADLAELEEDVKPTGFFHNKAKNIKASAKRLIDVYGGEVPRDLDDLLTLPGVGRKSANLVMGDVFGKPAIVTDTHCIRLTNRIGLVENKKDPKSPEKDPKKEEMQLWEIIPEEEGNAFCHRLVLHGREVCTARTKPYCDRCCLSDICRSAGTF